MSSSTRILGEVGASPCIRRGSWLNLEVYDQKRSNFPSELHYLFSGNDQHWKRVAKFFSPESGFRADYFEPKESGSFGVCPPVLVFRGSDTEPEDVAEIAVVFELGLNIESSIYNNSHQVPMVFSANSKLAESSPSQIRLLGYDSVTILEDTFDFTLQLQVAGIFSLVRARFFGTMRAEIFVGRNGDWATNIAQGLGMESVQYNQAILALANVVSDHLSSTDPKLNIVGHSLGGGLASQAAVYCGQHYKNVKMRAFTLNAAGLHPMTAARFGANLSSAPVNCLNVKDEILTTLQSNVSQLPLVGEIFRWSEISMPPAITNPNIQPGISDGAPTFPDFGQNLPKLWPIDEQNYFSYPWYNYRAYWYSDNSEIFSNILAVDSLAKSSPTAGMWLESVISYYLRGGRSILSLVVLFRSIKEEFRVVSKLAKAAVDYHVLPKTMSTYEHFFKQ